MAKSSRILSVLSALSLFANGTVLFAQNPDTGIQAASPPVRTLAAAGGDTKSEVTPDAGESTVPKQSNASEKSEGKPAAKEQASRAKPAYIKEEPVADPSLAPTRVHRPEKDAVLPPLAPPASGNAPVTSSPMPLYSAPPPAPPREKFPSVGQLEELMFGHSTPNINVDNRLDKLEAAIFQKKYPELDTEQRIKRLKEIIIGEEAQRQPPSRAYSEPPRTAYTRPANTFPPPDSLGMTLEELEKEPGQVKFFPNYAHHDLNQQLSMPEAEKFAVNIINEVRAEHGLSELTWDDKAHEIAGAQVADLIKRDVVSHQNEKGENPDVRYSRSGGSDALVESVIMFPAAEKLRPTRQLVVKMLESLWLRQDDKDALMSPHASGFSMSFKWTPDRQKLVCCTEVVTKHGQMEPLPMEATVGDKIEVKGSITAPYRFQKITLAWEGMTNPPTDNSAEISEAMPYFPPLDYQVHATKSNKDYDKGIKLLQIAGITAAIAGGFFIPPVALAAPLIAASITSPTPKAVSEIPVKGGVKTDGCNFSKVLTLSNQGKEGIYYVTVWANSGADDSAVAISRRTIIAHKNQSATDPAENKEEPDGTSTEKPKNEEKNDGGKDREKPGPT